MTDIKSAAPISAKGGEVGARQRPTPGRTAGVH